MYIEFYWNMGGGIVLSYLTWTRDSLLSTVSSLSPPLKFYRDRSPSKILDMFVSVMTNQE
uniref:Uncharacterized protein n=1 Tax=Arundo donax TaxID=35708 RepID=A0A0A9EKT2_ARUDO